MKQTTLKANSVSDSPAPFFTTFTKGENWVAGIAESDGTTYHFSAKLFDEGSEFGINNGRVSKLSIRKENDKSLSGFICNYDRGWDIEVEDKNKPVYNSIMNLLENAPKLF